MKEEENYLKTKIPSLISMTKSFAFTRLRTFSRIFEICSAEATLSIIPDGKIRIGILIIIMESGFAIARGESLTRVAGADALR